jgi:putative transposase
MARPLRIEYPNAYYHVSNRGEAGLTLFASDKYYQAFLAGLEEACDRFNVQVHAYCLLKNEYHLLVKTPEANLSRFMRQVDGLFTQYYQNTRNTVGSVFHSRYKSVLLQANPYLLEVSRYLHSLPARGQKQALDHPWSSMACYANKQKAPVWLEVGEVLGMLGKGKSARPYAGYVNFVDAGPSAEMVAFYKRKNLLSVLGDERFKSSAKSKTSPQQPRGISRGQSARQRPSMKQVVEAVARYFRVNEKSIYQASRGPSSKNVPRWVAMHLCQELSSVTLQDIAKRFGLKRYGTVSTTVGKLKQELETDGGIQKAVDILKKRLRS